MAPVDYAIETDNLTKCFGTLKAVDGIALSVAKGTFYGFLGPNGAGKSTTIKMLTGLLAPTSGKIRIFGKDFAENSLEIKSRIGVVPEELCLFENLTAGEYLAFIGRMYKMPRPLLADRMKELLVLMDLADRDRTLILEYSHGMRKKLALAAALIHDPEILFLDEPFEGIDPIASHAIKNILASIVKRGSTVFLTSHILEIVERLCSHVGIIKGGSLVIQRPIAELERPLEEVFVSAVGEEEKAEAGLSWLEDRPDA